LWVSHGPWHAGITISLPDEDYDALSQAVSWEHRHAAAVSPAVAAPHATADTVLFAARLARGLTLLTQGTAFDLVTHRYSNPSDWSDRPLLLFRSQDHVQVMQGETDGEDRQDWFYTLGMSKFGLDELETRQPKGLPGSLPGQVLAEAADLVLHQGHNPPVGSVLALSSLGRTVAIEHHRTATVDNGHRIFRRLASN
jgi:hypothetical protein